MAGLWLEWYNMPMAITAEKDTTLPAGARSPALTSALYGLAHLVVDYGSVSTLYHVTSGGLFSAQWIVALTVLFDYTAFALQMFLGPLLDRLAGGGKHHNAAGLGAAVGCALVAGGVWLAGAWPLGAALLGLGSLWPPTALAGVLCVNLTMAVTVAALAYLLPGWEGLAFGLTATALVIGLAPTGYGPWLPFLQQPAVVAGWCVLSAAALYPALRAVERLKK